MTAAELIIKLTLEGVGAVTKGVGEAAAAVKGFQNQVTLGALGPYTVGRDVVQGIKNLISGTIELGAKAVDTSNQFEEITASLQTIIGSAEIANQKMQFIKQLAIPSRYTALELAETGLQIEGLGLRIEKVLPLIAKLTMGTRRVDEGSRRMAVRLFSYLASGQMPRAEMLTAFGLSKADFMQRGATFSQGGMTGSLRGSAETNMRILEDIINSRFGRIFEQMAETGAARFSALEDLWTQLLDQMGGAIKTYLLPYVTELTRYMKFLIDSGFVQQVGDALSKAVFGRPGEQDAFMRAVALFTASVEQLPELIKTTFTDVIEASKIISGLFWGIVDVVGFITSGLKGTIGAIGYLFQNIRYTLVQALIEIKTGLYTVFNPFASTGDINKYRQSVRSEIQPGALAEPNPLWFGGSQDIAYRPRLSWFGVPGTFAQKNTDDILVRIQERAKGIFEAFQRAPGIDLGEPKDMGEGFANGIRPLMDPLEETAKNTRVMVRHFEDLKRYVVGGGQAGAISATPVEVASYRNMRPGQVSLRVPVTAKDWFGEMVQDALIQLNRQGVLKWESQ